MTMDKLMDSINNSLIHQIQSATLENNTDFQVKAPNNNFSSLLNDAISAVNNTHKIAGKAINEFETGKSDITLADVMIARSKAGLASDAAI